MAFECSNNVFLLGFPRPLLVAMVIREVVKGRLGDTERTRSARTASLNVVPEISREARKNGTSGTVLRNELAEMDEKKLDIEPPVV